ncbi:MAG TPA: EamA/RhaT family transporter, partial [Candidatus Accumulibacter sp.]|nr:EamA/RhaT family transporter [Accumulibacter sp.]
MRDRLQNPYLLLVLTVLFWSGNMVIGRALREQVPPLSLAFWRWAIAFALVLPLALPHLRAQWPLLRAGWKPVSVLGLLGVGGYNTLAYIGLQYTPATNAALLNSFIPIATITLSWAFLGRSLRAIDWLGVLTSFAGVSIIVSGGDPLSLGQLRLNVGDLWMLVAVFTWALYTIGLQWRPAGVDPMLLLAAFTLVGLLALA